MRLRPFEDGPVPSEVALMGEPFARGQWRQGAARALTYKEAARRGNEPC